MSRLIDADALIEKCGDWYVEEGTESGFIGTLENLLATQPTIQPEPHWIPVEQELPETSDEVLTTYIVNGDRSKRYVETSSYYQSSESWSSVWDEFRIAGTRIEVIAWQHLPEPYEGVTE